MQSLANLINEMNFTPSTPPPAATFDDHEAQNSDNRRMLGDLDPEWHPKVAQAIELARNWAVRRRETRRASFVLLATGLPNDPNSTGYGCGKTHIALSALWSECYVVDDVPIAPVGRFFTAAQLIANLDSETPIAAELGNAPILVLDDVGAEGEIAFIAASRQENERHSRYFRLIDYCYQRGVSVIITGNLSVHELARHIGGRAWSRLLEMAPTGYILDMTGVPDYRRHLSGRSRHN